jgi:restriction system protein
MTIPKYEQLMLPLLKVLAATNGEANVAMLIPSLAREFELTEDDLQQRLPSGGQTYFANRCHWAKFYLSRAGLLDGARRGYFKITDEGRKTLEGNTAALRDRKALMQIPQFAKWWHETPESKSSDEIAGPAEEPTDADATTPDERIDTAAKLLAAALEADLLARVRTVAPPKFEQIVVDLLIAMGFGGGDPEMGQRLGKTGDGGVDGVIQEDALGLDAVYVQAKRYKDGNNIGASTIREFVGSLVGNRATKGVFVTASKFTPDAREFARNVQHRIVLIDGEELTRLLVRHGVAVREDRRVVINKLDEDYFSEE